MLVDVAEPARSVVAVDGSARLLEPDQHWLLLGGIVEALGGLRLRELCRSDASLVVVVVVVDVVVALRVSMMMIVPLRS